MLGIQGSPKISFANQEIQETKPVIEEDPAHFQKNDKKGVARKNSNGLQFQGVSLKEEIEPVNLVQPSIEPVAKYFKEEEKAFKAHKKANQEETEAHICNLCGKIFSYKANLARHLKSHNKQEIEKVACDQCSKICSNKYRLNVHMKTHAPKSEVARQKVKSLCNICSKWLASRTLGDHTKSAHGENKHQPCSSCGNNFRLSCVRSHERVCKLSEEEKAAIKVECDQCGKNLANKWKLARHIRFVHNKEKLLKCQLCDHKDYRGDNMKTHIKNNHKGEDPKDLFSSLEVVPSPE